MLLDIFGRRKLQKTIPCLGYRHPTNFLKAKRMIPCGYSSASLSIMWNLYFSARHLLIAAGK